MKVAAPELRALETVGRVSPKQREGQVAGANALDDHFPVRGTGNLNPPVLKSRHRPRTLPRRIVPDVLGLLEEVRKSTRVELSLEELATVQERFAGRVEVAVEDGEELEGGGGEDLSVTP